MSDSRSASALSGEVPAGPAVVSIEDRSVMFRDHVAEQIAEGHEVSFAWVIDADGKLTWLEMPGLDGHTQRWTVKQAAASAAAVMVCHALEVWYTDLELGDLRQPQADAAIERGELHKLPYVKEAVQIYEESSAGLLVHRAQILREESASRLAPWVPLKVILPRPNFRRYLAEKRSCA